MKRYPRAVVKATRNTCQTPDHEPCHWHVHLLESPADWPAQRNLVRHSRFRGLRYLWHLGTEAKELVANARRETP